MTAVFHERRAFISAPLRCVGAARREDTALRQFIEHRHIARNAEQGVFFFIKTRDGCLQSLGIGMFWLRKDLFPFGIFYQLAAYMTATRSAIWEMTPISWLMKITEVPVSFCRRRISPRIWACTVTSSAVVGSSQIRSRGCRSAPWRS